MLKKFSCFFIVRRLFIIVSLRCCRWLYNTYTCRNITTTSMSEQRHFFRKIYLSIYSKGLRKGYERDIEWEARWRLNKDCNILTATLLTIAAYLSCSPQQRSRGPGDLEHWLQTLISNWLNFSVAPGYIIVLRPPAFCDVTIRTQFNPLTVKVIPRYLRPDAPVIYTGAFPIWRLDRVGGQYVTYVERLYQ